MVNPFPQPRVMRLNGQPLYLAGLALVPALASVLVPHTAATVPALLGLAGFGGTYALLSSLTGRVAVAPRGRRLLSYAGARRLGRMLDMPGPEGRRAALERVLTEGRRPLAADAPVPRQVARARTLTRIMVLWGHRSPGELDEAELLDLYALLQVIGATPARAGELSMAFRRPSAVLAIRDQLSVFDMRHRALSQQASALSATLILWETGQAVGTLVGLESLGAADPDLWHQVVMAHDADNPASRATALWSVRQQACDRSTVAAYLADLGRTRALSAAVKRGDSAMIEGIAQVIAQWNDRRYPRHGIGLDREDAVLRAGPDFAADLDEVARLTGRARLPDPRGLFTLYQGRAPLPRSAWCTSTGLLIAAPDPADYVIQEQAAA